MFFENCREMLTKSFLPRNNWHWLTKTSQPSWIACAISTVRVRIFGRYGTKQRKCSSHSTILLLEAQHFNTDLMKDTVADLHSAHVEFQNLQLMQKANDDFCAPSFIPTVPLYKPDTESQIQTDTLVSDACVIVKKEEHYEDVVLDQPKSVTKEDCSMMPYSPGLGLSQSNSQSPVPQNTSMPDPSIVAVNKDEGIKDDDEMLHSDSH